MLYTDAANTLVIVASSPLWAALLSRIILKEKIAIWTAVATVFAFGAVVMVFLTEILDNGSVDADVSNAATTATAPPMTTTTPTSTTANASLAGDASGNLVAATKSTPQQHAVGMLLALVVALAMAGYLCCVRYAALHYPERDMVPTSAIAGVLSAIAGAVGMVATGGTALVTGAPMGWLALQGLVVLPVAFICMTLGPKYISATETNLMLLLETVFGPVWVYAAGYEAPATLAAAGIAVIVVCLVVNGIFTIRAANKATQVHVAVNGNSTQGAAGTVGRGTDAAVQPTRQPTYQSLLKTFKSRPSRSSTMSNTSNAGDG